MELKTLGDHLRKVRLDRGLSQPDVARMLEVDALTVTGWELNHHEPPARLAKAIIAFLGYFPFSGSDHSLGRQLYYARLITGKTQKQVAKEIDCDASNLRVIELDRKKPGLFSRPSNLVEAKRRQGITPCSQKYNPKNLGES
ncbi:MAG: helix-turn-helix domain-containing protein [Saprospiraceae bacterium]